MGLVDTTLAIGVPSTRFPCLYNSHRHFLLFWHKLYSTIEIVRERVRGEREREREIEREIGVRERGVIRKGLRPSGGFN